MSTSAKVKAVLSYHGKKQVELAGYMGIAKQSLTNKMVRDSWSAKDLAKVAAFCGCKVGFILSDDQHILIEQEEAADE